jgi:DNA-binding MarR family transcriptional regulator
MAAAQAAAMAPFDDAQDDTSTGDLSPADVLRRLQDLCISAHLFSKLKYAQATARAALAAEFDRIGLTTPQFLALAAIELNADISSAELARQSFVTPQAMITIVARLESSGLITRVPAARGGRSLTMRLTAKGAQLLSEARTHAYAIERYILELLGPEQYSTLMNSLDRITIALSQGTTLKKTSPWDVYLADAPVPPLSAAADSGRRRAGTTTTRRTSRRRRSRSE